MDGGGLRVIGEEKFLRPELSRFQFEAHRRGFLLAIGKLQIGVGRTATVDIEDVFGSSGGSQARRGSEAGQEVSTRSR